MKVDIEQVNPHTKKFRVEVPKETVEEKVEEMYAKLRKTVQIPGFRKGKAPRSVIEQVFGKQILEDVRGQIIDETFKEVMEEHGKDLEAVSEPAVDPGRIERGADLSYEVSVEIKPEIEPQGYDGLDLDRLVLKVEDKDVDDAVKNLREKAAVLQSVDDDYMAVDGDYLTIDYEAFVDGQPFEGSERQGFSFYLGQGQVLAGVDTALVGAKKGEKKTLRDTFPEDYHNHAVAGDEAEFHVSVTDIKRKVLPEVDDEFAKDVGEFENLGQLKEKVREDIESYQKNLVETSLRSQLADKLIEANPVEPPPSMIERQASAMFERTRRNMAEQGVDLQKAGIDPNMIRANLREEAAKQVQIGLILEAIAEKEGLKVEESDLEKHYEEISGATDQPTEKVKAWYEKNGLIEVLQNQMREEKVLDFLMEKANIKDKEKTE